MSESIVAQEARKVKRDNVCCWPGCENETEPGCPLCPSCLKWEREQGANRQAERQACAEGMGYVFGDPVDKAWCGFPVEEVCQ